MDPAFHNARAFFGRRKGHKLRPRQAGLFETLLPRLALDLARPPPAELASLFIPPVTAVWLEIGFGSGEAMLAEAKAHPHIGFIGVEPFVNGMAKALVAIPTKVGALVHAIGGGQRDPQTPMSVVGASIVGGDTVDHGLWVAFWFFLAQLNLILGAINLVPLLPFDGGHIAIAVFEKIRNAIRSARGMVAAAPVNYLKLMPATYVVLVFVVGYMLLTVTADVVNPIRIFQ